MMKKLFIDVDVKYENNKNGYKCGLILVCLIDLNHSSSENNNSLT